MMTFILGGLILALYTYAFVLGPDHLEEWEERKHRDRLNT